jgi:hypothetical protein
MNACIHKPRAITQRLCCLTCDAAMPALLLISVAWLPADFGLAFYTNQIAQNTAQEGGAARRPESTLVASDTTCNIPARYSFGKVFNETAARLPAALPSFYNCPTSFSLVRRGTRSSLAGATESSARSERLTNSRRNTRIAPT